MFSERKLNLVEKSDFLYAKTVIQAVILLMIVIIEACWAGRACWMIASNWKQNALKNPGCDTTGRRCVTISSGM
jgi:hypothetical protein